MLFGNCRTICGWKVMQSVNAFCRLNNALEPLCSSTFIRHYCIPSNDDLLNKNEEPKTKKGGFARAYDKFSTPEDTPKIKDPTFLSLLKNSKFIDLGDPEGKVVTGTIFHIVDDDLYVDFGWKFHCVVSRPAKNGHEYVRGARVRLSIKDLELSSRFLGSEKDLTLLEAEATLLGLVSSPARFTNVPTS